MSTIWPVVPLFDLLDKGGELATILPDRVYHEVTVKLWGRGVVLRGRVKGSDLLGQRRFVSRAGQLILSRIDARNGALGIVPVELDGAVVTNDFPLYRIRGDLLDARYLGWLSRTSSFVEACRRASEGTTNRVRLKEERFLRIAISLPPLAEQRAIVTTIDDLSLRVDELRGLRKSAETGLGQTVLSAFREVAAGAPRKALAVVAPLVRRPVQVDPMDTYRELGIRSFGKGTFHKPALTGLEIGDKRIFKIEPGDLLFSNVFAWEGAIAVARKEDAGRVGSHRFMSCVPIPAVAVTPFLCFFFLTEEGLDMVRAASPGGAGRNRTLGLEGLARMEVPVPPLRDQMWFADILEALEAAKVLYAATSRELDAIIPAALDEAFNGQL